MFYTPHQLLNEAKSAFWVSDKFEPIWFNYQHTDFSALRCESPHETIRFQATGAKVTLRFHTHPWCGTIFLEQNGEQELLDLYSEEHGFLNHELVSDSSGHIDIVIRTGAPPNPSAKDNQVWLVGIDFSERQKWTPRTINASSFTRLTLGEEGTFLTLSTDAIIGTTIVKEGVWARKDVEFFRTIIEKDMVVLDIGANIGHHTVLYSKLVGPGGFVIGFEPQKLIHRIATANLAINGCSNADVIKCALADAPGTVSMFPIDYNTITNFGALGADRSTENNETAEGEIVPLRTLDEVILEKYSHLTRLDFMKIDVQSYELFVLKGGLEVIRKFKPKLFFEIAPHWMQVAGYDYTEAYDLLRNEGYVFDHLDGSNVSADNVKSWSGREGEEWDVFAYVPD